MEKWRGKIAVVTGGSSGIGAAITKELVKYEVKTIILDVNEPSDNFGDLLNFFKCDVSNLDSIKGAFKWIEENFETVHILISNAGIGRSFSLSDISEDTSEQIEKIVSVNFLGVVHCAREALKLMQKSNDYGIIINTSSVAGIVNVWAPLINVYGPAKHAVRSFSEILRQELAFKDNEKIRITNLSPGVVDTNIYKSSGFDMENFQKPSNALEPENIAEGVVFVLSTPYKVNVSEITIRSMCEKF